jgi:ABC-2 type transport system permease protein
MSTALAALPAYVALARAQMRVVSAYRAGVMSGLVIALFRIFLLDAVWTAIYSAQGAVSGPLLSEVITFLTLTQLQLLVLQPSLVTYLQRRIHDGQIGFDLVRPVPLLGQLVAQQAGATLGLVPLVLLALPFALVVGGLALPASPVAGLTWAFSLLLAWAIASLLGLLMGLVAFWTVETLGVQVIYTFATQFLGGALAPLVFFPPVLRGLADWLPFRAIASVPIELYTGARSGIDGVATAIGLQLAWIVVLGVVALITWGRAKRVITIYRG